MPKSMMDPAELKNIEERVENLKGIFGLSGESSISSRVAVNTAIASHSSIESSAAMANRKRAYEENSANMSNDEDNYFATEAQAQTSAQGQQMIIAKKSEGEAAFARARLAKSESGWNEAKEVAIAVSNYWQEVVEAIQTGNSPLSLSEEEATIQKDYWMEKADVAEVQALGVTPCGDNYSAKCARANAMMGMIEDKVWPTVSQAMKAFIEHPSEARMLAVREAASTFASASASASAYTSTSSSVSAFASASTSASASAFASTFAYASAFASAYLSTFAYDYTYNYDYASAYEALQAACMAEEVADDTKVFVEMSLKKFKISDNQQFAMNFSINATRETADFARAVAKYKEAVYREQITENTVEDKSQDHATVVAAKEAVATAKILKSEDAWKTAGAAVREAVRLCQNVQGMSSREAIEATQQKNYWTEQANIADVKALATSPCAGDWKSQLNRANAIIKMACEKFGSPVSQAMKAFIANPSETTLRATGKPAIIAMSATEAEEALEGAELFAKASTDAAALAKKNNRDDSFQESINLSVFVMSEVAEFSRAVAAFKRGQEAAKQPQFK